MGKQINKTQVKLGNNSKTNTPKSKEKDEPKVCHTKLRKVQQKSNELSLKDVEKKSFKGSEKLTKVENFETRKISSRLRAKNKLSNSQKSANKKIESNIHSLPECDKSLLAPQIKRDSNNSDRKDTEKSKILNKKQICCKRTVYQNVKEKKLTHLTKCAVSKFSKNKTKEGTRKLSGVPTVTPKHKAYELSFEDIEKKIFESSEKLSESKKISKKVVRSSTSQGLILDNCSINKLENDTALHNKCNTSTSHYPFPKKDKNKADESSFEDIAKKIFESSEEQPKSKKLSKKVVRSSTSQDLALENDTVLHNKCNTSHYPSRKKVKKKETYLPPQKNSFSKVKTESDSENDWEDVDELSEILGTQESNITKDVQIELKASNVLWGIKRRKKRTQQQLIEDYLRKQMNKSIKEVYVNMHKTHLLCLLAHGIYLNNCLASDSLLSTALSIVPKSYFTPKKLDLSHLKKFLSWFYKLISIKKDKSEVCQLSENEEILCQRFKDKVALNDKELVLMFVAIGRSLGMTVRLVQNLNPLLWKPPMSSLIKPSTVEKDGEIQSILVSPSTSKECSQSKIKKKSRKILSSDSEIDNADSTQKSKLEPEITSDEDFEGSLNLKSAPSHKNKDKKKLNGKRLSSQTAYKTEVKRQKVSLAEWAEVYMEEEEMWISVDIVRCKIHCTSEIEARLTNPSYIIGFNPDQSVKDITMRYVSNWLSCKDKIQYDRNWWAESLKPFLGQIDQRSKDEDKALEENLKLQPLPKTLADYKNHPLYALHRHLLKFEAIYPADESPVGYFRGEPVFPRTSVKILMGREHWIKEAKTVRVDEEPYKVVKARPKWDKTTCQMIKDRPLELFGEWQVEDYEPPIAKNGKVPRNEYGNVELFKPCMLPRGCIHIPISGIARVARRLNIDCVPAVVGFDYHSGGSHPIYEGFVICEEAEDILMDAWNQEQFERAKKELEKRTKRVYDNWKRLIMGITLKDRLKERYGIAQSGAEKVTEEKHSGKLKRGKIKQEDLEELSSNLITHSVPNLKIDFSTGFNGASSSQTRKRKSAKPKVMDTSFGKDDLVSPRSSPDSSAESENEFTKEEKRMKIRRILQWNPQTLNSQHFGSTLSDESDSDTADMPVNLTQTVSSYSQKKRRRKLNPRIKDQERVSKDIEHGLLQTSALMNPRSRRSLKQIQYTEIDECSESKSDITINDSDISDKAYTPDLAQFPHGRSSSDSE